MIRLTAIILAVIMTVVMHPLTWATLEGASWLPKTTLDLGTGGLIGPAAPVHPLPPVWS
jgi:hypothetical protein